MNLILGRSKQEHANMLWEPFATSTPMKVVPNNGKIIHELKLLTQIGSVNYFGNSLKGPCTSDIFQEKLTQSKDSIPKKGKRNKSSAFFDLSSSGDDDDDPPESRRPIIKIGSSKKSRCLLKTKKLESEESVNKVSEPVDSYVKPKSVESKENAIPAKVDLKSEKGNTQDGKRKAKIGSIKSNSVISCVNSNERSKISDESKNNNLTRGSRSSSTLNNKKIELNHSKSEVKLNEANDAMLFKKTKAKLIKSRSKLSEIKPQNEEENNKVLKTLKRRSTNNLINNIPVKKSVNKNTKSKSSAQRNKCESTQLHIWKKKRNLSHQLFNDTREQEFINTLDLTSEDINEAIESKNSGWQKCKEIPHTQGILSDPLNGNVDNTPKTEEDKQERPKRKKQKPKEFWIPDSESDKSSKNNKIDRKEVKKKNSKVATKKELNPIQKPQTELNDQPILSEDVKENDPENAFKANSLRSPKPLKKERRKKGKIQKTEKSNESNDAVVTSSNDNKITILTTSVFNCSRTNVPADRDLELNNMCVENATAGEQTSTADIKVFKQLNKLPFKDNGKGCFASECWQTNNLKCGVFKLLVNSQLTYKTLHRNSHLGGVVVKGTLKMKIGDKVLDLKEGDMAFVPPKTEWRATNIGECESVFYYWCGRFNC